MCAERAKQQHILICMGLLAAASSDNSSYCHCCAKEHNQAQQQAAAQALLCPRLPLQAVLLLTCALRPLNHTSSGFLLARDPFH
jgi:hypothetical protein